MNEEEIWIILHREPRKIDSDLLFDLSVYGRYRAEQILRWRKQPEPFMYRDITGMRDSAARRRKEAIKKIIQQFKEGTNVGREGEDQD